MACVYSDSSSESDGTEDFVDAVRQVVAESDITGASWYAERSSQDAPTDEQPSETVNMTARAYQLEMLDASLRENIICAMDTGSGKTQVAILRMKAELERMPEGRIIWFLAPTVSLCAQQYEVVKTQIPSIQTKLITGANMVDSWSRSTWDGALVNVKIVITTPQVLFDALTHGFVKISALALLILDEAHHCNNNHPYGRIMKEFYSESQTGGLHVPHILGLTASPVIRSDISSLVKLEATLDAVCRSPTKHRDELLSHSQRPSLITVPFKPKTQLPSCDYTESMAKLIEARNKLDIMEDPYIISLRAEKTDRSKDRLAKALKTKSTYVQNSMKSFCRRSCDIAKDLGGWAADWYIYKTIQHFMAGVGRQSAVSQSFRDAEVVHLAMVFEKANIGEPPPFEPSSLSDKVQQLINVLLKYEGDARGIVFVKERATTVLLAHILELHPEVKKIFQIGTMVGLSFVPGVKQNFLDIPETGGVLSLEAFRAGKKNLLVATSVLEEGIDVPACNLVICVDKPSHLRSFIQRRGRARMRESHLYLFTDEEQADTSTNWEDLEAEMKRHYEDDMRKLQKLKALEDAELHALDYPEIRVESTGAKLTIHEAKSHLQHFCATLAHRKHVDYYPDYLVEELHDSARPGAPIMLRATVLLPVMVPLDLRQATSSRSWMSEKHACMDAAFQAYQALYQERLVDEHLLPLRDALERDVEGRPGLKKIRAPLNPWVGVADAWESNQLSRRALKVLDHSGSVFCEIELVIPSDVPDMNPMVVWWDYDTPLTLRLDSDVVMADGQSAADDHTCVLLSLAYGHRAMEIKDDCVIRFICPESLSMDQIGNISFTADLAARTGGFLVRDERGYARRHPYFFDSFLPCKPPIDSIRRTYKGFKEDADDMHYLAVKKWPRNWGFYHRPGGSQPPPSTKPYALILPAESTTIDSIPLVYAQFGLLIPPLINLLGMHLLAKQLSQSLLSSLSLSDASMVVEAICASSAQTPKNYERVEFLGDSILKTCITVNVTATNLRLPEGLLSLLKDRLVSNARLSRAACESGLDQYIITQQLVVKGWRPPYVSDLKEEEEHGREGTRILSTKTLADVVEAIIGISYLDGGLLKALECIRLFIPESQAGRLSDARDILLSAAAPKNIALPADLQPLEELIEYTFREKSLLVEAVTHPSYNLRGVVACFDRLEFLGDAILDFIVVQEVYAVDPPLENWKMHLLRTALVNADILGFLVMEWSYKQLRFDVRVGASGPELARAEDEITLWDFMRHSSAELTFEREATRIRHAKLRRPILEAMQHGTHYPWALLARLRAQKFYSDLFEALVGAIWVDSGPDFEACRALVERSGVLPYLRRLLSDEVHVLHPKEELGRLAGSETVEYMTAEVSGPGVEREWTCEVRVGERSVVSVSSCLFKEEAKVKAATRACEILKSENM